MPPLPTPRDDEPKDEFVERCMSEAGDEYEDGEQRRAVCERQWDDAKAVNPSARYRNIVKTVRDTPWAILPETLAAIVEVIRLRAGGGRLTDEEIRARIGARTAPETRAVGRVHVIPVFGVLSHRMNMFANISGGTSTEQLGAQLQQALNDTAVGAIVFDVDSPGGSVAGIQELADAIFAARGRKPMVAVANATCASAAYWLASQADEVVVTPSGQVGSIGVLAIHEDLTKQAEMLGVKVTYVGSAPYKAEGQPFTPLTDEARADLQSKVNQYHGAFLRAVARGRDESLAVVDLEYGQGRMVTASDAKKRGMVDNVSTLEATIERLNRQLASGGGTRAEGRTGTMEVKDNAGKETPTPVRDGEIVVKLADLKDLREKAARADRYDGLQLEQKLLNAEREKAEAEEGRRQDRIAHKVRSLKIPAFRAFARVFYELAAIAYAAEPERTYVVIDPKKPIGAEASVDAFLAEMNRQAETLFATLSTPARPVDTDEPEDAGDRVEYRVRKYIAERKLDPTKDYQTAMRAVLDADPELKEAYARS